MPLPALLRPQELRGAAATRNRRPEAVNSSVTWGTASRRRVVAAQGPAAGTRHRARGIQGEADGVEDARLAGPGGAADEEEPGRGHVVEVDVDGAGERAEGRRWTGGAVSRDATAVRPAARTTAPSSSCPALLSACRLNRLGDDGPLGVRGAAARRARGRGSRSRRRPRTAGRRARRRSPRVPARPGGRTAAPACAGTAAAAAPSRPAAGPASVRVTWHQDRSASAWAAVLEQVVERAAQHRQRAAAPAPRPARCARRSAPDVDEPGALGVRAPR